MTDLALARSALEKDLSLTCAFVKDGETVTSKERGVKPLLRLAEEGKTLAGTSCADRVVGRAAALLYAFLGAKEVYAFVLSGSAEEVLNAHNIAYGCGKRTPAIVNRRGDGPCPMEEATRGISDPVRAFYAIKAKAKTLR